MSNHNNMKTNTQSEAIASLQDWLRTDWTATVTDIAQDAISISLLIDRLHRRHPQDIDGQSQLTELLDNLGAIIEQLRPVYESLNDGQQNMSNHKTAEP